MSCGEPELSAGKPTPLGVGGCHSYSIQMVFVMVRKSFILLFFLLFFSTTFVHALDSDNDNVSDAQEKIDQTNPLDANDNLLNIKIDGSLTVGNTVQAALIHPSLGRIKGVDFTFLFGETKQSLNSGSSGAVDFTISSAGYHLLKVKKGDFFKEVEFYPECAVIQPVAVKLSDFLFFLTLFVSFVIGALAYAGFRKLLLATEADYPLKKHPVIVPAYVGVSVTIIMIWLYFSLGQLFGLMALFFCLLFLIVLLWTFRVKGLLKPVPEKISPKKTHKAVKGLAFVPLLIAAFIEKLKGKKVKKKEKKHSKLKEMMDLKRDISESLKRIEKAKEKSTKARERKLKQEAMDELRRETTSFNQYLKRLLGFKEKEKKTKKIEKEKTLEELRKEKRLKIMTEDLLDQMAREMDVAELPEKKSAKGKEKAKKGKKILKKLAAFFIGEKKEKTKESKKTARKANVEIKLFDEFGNPLNASKAKFFVGGKETKPKFVDKNLAGLQLKPGEYQVFVRLLGFIDSFLEVKASEEKNSFEARLTADFKLLVVDEAGNPINEVFANIVDEHGSKVGGVLNNIIWRSPTPKNAPLGTIAIPLNPKNLSFNSFKVKVVKAKYTQTEVVIPTNRISTEKTLEKRVSLEKIKE